MITSKCPHCQAGIRGEDHFAGRVVTCPKCKKQVQMPGNAYAPSAEGRQHHPSPPGLPSVTSQVRGPGADVPFVRPKEKCVWYYVQNDQRIGPVDENTISALIQDRTIVRQTSVWKEGMPDWVQAATTELQSEFGSVPPDPPPYSGLKTRSTSVRPYAPRSSNTLLFWFKRWLPLIGFLSLFSGLTITTICFAQSWESVGSILGFGTLVTVIASLIAEIVLFYVLLYRFWGVIQDGKARTSPVKAVGLCFVPIFNIYWMYVAIVGLAEDMNMYCNERKFTGLHVNEGLALTWFILSVFASVLSSIYSIIPIPLIGVLSLVMFGILWLISIRLYEQFADTATRIAEGKG